MNRSILLVGVFSLLLTACGGGGGGSSPAPAPIATAPPTAQPPVGVTASGVVTGFGSVFIDAVKYEVENDTVVAIEGAADVSGDDSELRVGMKVRVHAVERDNERVAERIEYDDDLKGPARNVMPDALNPETGTFSVLRQSVIVDANTVFDDDIGDNNGDGVIDIRDLSLAGGGQVVVEVSGLPITDGFIATRIERVNSAAGIPGVPDDEYEVKGFVSAVAADGSSFNINDATFLVVEGAGGTEFQDGLSADDSLLGVFVEVKVDINSGDEFVAVRVEREDDFGDINDDGRFDRDDRVGKFEIKGILISVDTGVDPDVVVIGGATLQVADASSLSGLEGSLIELKGTFDDNGVLILSEAHPEIENSVRTEDRVAGVDTTAGSFTTRLGIVVTPTGGSRVEDDVSDDDSGDHLTPAQFLARLEIDDFIEARGFPNADGSVNWTRIEREAEDDLDCRLRGRVESIEGTDANDFNFVIQGVTIDVSQIVSDDEFQNSSDQGIGRQLFYDNLDVGDVVQATSDTQGLGCEADRLTARQVEFEVDDDIVGSLPQDQGTGDDTGNGGIANNVSGVPTEVTANTFNLNGQTITVVGSTLIDDSIIESALGTEFNGDDRRFDQLPAGLTLPDLLPGTFSVSVDVTADNVALLIEDL